MDDEINLREYLAVLWKRWKVIVLITLGLTLFVFIYSFLQEPVYVAKTTILVRSGGGGTSSQFANLAGLAGIQLSSSKGSLGDLTELLQSKAVAVKVVEDLKLRERIEGWDDPELKDHKLAGSVKGMLKESNISGNFIELKVENGDPELAADIANGLVGALSFYLNKLNYTEAQKKKEYIESQLPRVEKKLKQAERRMKKFTILFPKGGATSGLMGNVSAVYSQGIEVSRLSRELEIQNSVYMMLRKEYESVKLEESKEIEPFTVIDVAEVPESPFKPRVKFNIQIGLLLGLFLGIFMAFFIEYWGNTERNKN